MSDDILKNFSLLNWFPIYTNFKMAAILAGPGVSARNSLVCISSSIFGFDMKICVTGFNVRIDSLEEK
ncbi:MAG: hypothetical protein IT393_05955 [Nitrospirae bacterium]|nr:hypothetical protein [Nitrospirota bacterium]